LRHFNNTIYTIDPLNINTTIENVVLLRNFFKNIIDYYLHYEKDIIPKINFSIDIMNQTYLNILDVLVGFRNKIFSQTQHFDL